MKRLINLTPHDINVVIDNKIVVFLASGLVARCENSNAEVVDTVTVSGIDIPIVVNKYKAVIDLPEPQEDVIYLVSSMVGNHSAVKHIRTDLLGPDTSPEGALRNDKGVIVGVKRLQRYV